MTDFDPPVRGSHVRPFMDRVMDKYQRDAKLPKFITLIPSEPFVQQYHFTEDSAALRISSVMRTEGFRGARILRVEPDGSLVKHGDAYVKPVDLTSEFPVAAEVGIRVERAGSIMVFSVDDKIFAAFLVNGTDNRPSFYINGQVVKNPNNRRTRTTLGATEIVTGVLRIFRLEGKMPA